MLVFVSAVLCVPEGVEATGMPVVDVAHIAVTTANGVTLGTIAASTATQSEAYQARKGPFGSGVGLDTVAWMVGKIAIQTMTKSMVNWINSGFHGSPAFVSDLEGQLQVVGDAAAYGFLKELSTNSAINSPFRSQVVKAAALGYYAATTKNAYFQVNTYTLKNYTTNDKAFLAGDFSKGGWQAWLQAAANPQNNPYGASIAVGDELTAQVTTTKNKTMVQLNWGQGFMSWCGDVDVNKNGAASNNADSETVEVTTLKSTDPSGCTKSDGTPGQTQTPGSVIQSQINQTLGLTGDTLVTADEFNEVIGALMTQLVGQVMGATGLSGASVSSNTSSITAAITDSTANATLITAMNTELTQLQKYQTNWQTIKTEADLATAALATCPADSAVAQTNTVTVVAATKQAQLAIATSTTAIAALQVIQSSTVSAIAETAAGASTAAADLAAANTAYQTFIAAATTPSATDFAYATAQSADNSSTIAATPSTTPTLFTQMQQIVASPCVTPTPASTTTSS